MAKGVYSYDGRIRLIQTQGDTQDSCMSPRDIQKLRGEEHMSQPLDITMKNWIDFIITIPPWITSKYLGQSFLCLSSDNL